MFIPELRAEGRDISCSEIPKKKCGDGTALRNVLSVSLLVSDIGHVAARPFNAVLFL
jgi:hypothetical protein